jgi:hypothetical protein
VVLYPSRRSEDLRKRPVRRECKERIKTKKDNGGNRKRQTKWPDEFRRFFSSGVSRTYRVAMPFFFRIFSHPAQAGHFRGCLKSQLFKQPRKFGGRESAEFAREFRFLPLFSSISGEKSRKNVAASRREITRRVV